LTHRLILVDIESLSLSGNVHGMSDKSNLRNSEIHDDGWRGESEAGGQMEGREREVNRLSSQAVGGNDGGGVRCRKMGMKVIDTVLWRGEDKEIS